jgi:sorbitol/mannitol transport system permease protein
MLHPSFGINSVIAQLFGVNPVDFLGHHPMLTVIILVVWQWTPFFVLIQLAGLQSIPEEILESAKIDGADWLRSILQIQIPAIANHIEVAIMLGLIFILKVFGLIYVTTSGGPGIASTNLSFIVYRTGFYRWDVGVATAMAVVSVVLTLIAIMNLFKFVRRQTKGVEA